MNKQQAIAHFGSQAAVAAALGIKQPSVAGWGENPPELQQLALEQITGGALQAGPECDRYRVAPRESSKEAA